MTSRWSDERTRSARVLDEKVLFVECRRCKQCRFHTVREPCRGLTVVFADFGNGFGLVRLALLRSVSDGDDGDGPVTFRHFVHNLTAVGTARPLGIEAQGFARNNMRSAPAYPSRSSSSRGSSPSRRFADMMRKLRTPLARISLKMGPNAVVSSVRRVMAVPYF